MSVMAAAMALQFLSGMQSYEAKKAEANAKKDYLWAQGKAELVKMGYALQNYEADRQAAFTNTVQSLMEVQRKGVSAVSSVQAAVNEAGDSRGARRIVRDTHGELDTALMNLKRQYEAKSNEIDQNKWLTWQNTNLALDNINSTQVAMPSLMGTMLNTASGMLGTYSTYAGINANEKAAGIWGGNQDTGDWFTNRGRLGSLVTSNPYDSAPINLRNYEGRFTSQRYQRLMI